MYNILGREFEIVLFLFCLFVCLFVSAVQEEDAFSRMKEVVRWYLSGFYKKPKVEGAIHLLLWKLCFSCEVYSHWNIHMPMIFMFLKDW